MPLCQTCCSSTDNRRCMHAQANGTKLSRDGQREFTSTVIQPRQANGTKQSRDGQRGSASGATQTRQAPATLATQPREVVQCHRACLPCVCMPLLAHESRMHPCHSCRFMFCCMLNAGARPLSGWGGATLSAAHGKLSISSVPSSFSFPSSHRCLRPWAGSGQDAEMRNGYADAIACQEASPESARRSDVAMALPAPIATTSQRRNPEQRRLRLHGKHRLGPSGRQRTEQASQRTALPLACWSERLLVLGLRGGGAAALDRSQLAAWTA